MSERELNQFKNVINNLNRDGIISITNFNDKALTFVAEGTTVELPLSTMEKSLKDLTKNINQCRKLARR